jgi:Carboxypeptidase regulatory-like domain
MRPNLIFGLVLLAVGALVYVLLSGGPAREEEGGAVTLQPRGGQEAARPSSDLNAVATIETVKNPDRTAAMEAPPATVREIVGDAQPGFSGRLIGTVRGAGGEAVSQALLQVRRGAGNSGLGALQLVAGGPPDPSQIWTTRTNAVGEYDLPAIPPGDNYVITAKHQDYAPCEVSMLSVLPTGDTRRDIVMTDGFVVLGYVRDFNTGQPIAKARLRLVDLILSTLPPDDPRVTAATCETDESGLFRFDHVAPGMRSLTAAADTYGAQTKNDVNVGQQPTTAVDFRLQPGVVMRGQVVSPSRQGIGGARITALSDSGVNSQGRAVSKPDGSFEIAELTEGTYSLIADAPGWGTRRLNRQDASAQDVLIEMIQQGSVEGQVKDRASGEPVTSFKALVRAVIPNSTIYGRRVGAQDVKNEPQGRFLVNGLDTGQYVVEIQAEGYAPTYSEPFQVTQGLVVSGIQIFVSPGGKLTGIVLNGLTNEPVVGAEVKTFDNAYVHHALMDLLGSNAPRTTTERSVRTDEEGRFELEYLWPDVYQIQISRPGLLKYVRKDVRVVDSSTPTDLGVIKLEQGARLRGVVLDGAGLPIPAAMVTLANTTDPTSYYNTASNESGAYEFGNVTPGSYRLHATRPADPGDPFRSIADMNTSQLNVMLYEGREIVQDLRISN